MTTQLGIKTDQQPSGMDSYQIQELEEKLAEYYWYWRSAMDDGNDIEFKAQAEAFLAVLRVYQDALRAKGHKFA